MTVMTEREALARMGINGLPICVEIVCELLTQIGYEDTAKELARRHDETNYFDEDDWS